MKNKKVYNSLLLSVIVQVVTGIIDAIGLFVDVPYKFSFLKKLLKAEFTVQIIEGSFYVYWLNDFKNIANITPKRYIDWMFTTPTMLITLIFYLIFLNTHDNNKGELKYFELFGKEFKTIAVILILNWMMLLFGYLGEVSVIPIALGVFLGFIPFIIYYYMIYKNYVEMGDTSLKIFTYFVFFWSIYGIVALLPYEIKNTCYNILDLFSKNFFGLFLTYLIIKNKI
jgi:bacteriorhodopsin